MVPDQVVRILPKVIAVMEVTLKGEKPVHFTYEGDIPKEVMDAYESVVGNGLAKVSVSADMGIKDFGTGASSMCTVTLTCNQDEKTLERALALAGELARGYAQENRHRAEAELQSLIQQRQGQNPNYR